MSNNNDNIYNITYKINVKYNPKNIIRGYCIIGDKCGYLPNDFFKEFNINSNERILNIKKQSLKFKTFIIIILNWIKNNPYNIDEEDLYKLMIFLCRILLSIYGGLYLSLTPSILKFLIEEITKWSTKYDIFIKFITKMKEIKSLHDV